MGFCGRGHGPASILYRALFSLDIKLQTSLLQSKPRGFRVLPLFSLKLYLSSTVHGPEVRGQQGLLCGPYIPVVHHCDVCISPVGDGRRSLVCCSPWDHRARQRLSDWTELWNLHPQWPHFLTPSFYLTEASPDPPAAGVTDPSVTPGAWTRLWYPGYFQFSSVAQSCPTLCSPMDCSTSGLPVHHQLPKFTQTQVHWFGDAIQPSHPLLPLLLLASIFPSIRVSSNESVLHIRWPKYWSFSFSIRPCNEYSGLISFRIDWLDLLAVQGRGSQEFSPTP